MGDPIEIDGIKGAFAQYTDKRQFCAIGSVKSNIGHLYESAGITGLVKAVMSLKKEYYLRYSILIVRIEISISAVHLCM